MKGLGSNVGPCRQRFLYSSRVVARGNLPCLDFCHCFGVLLMRLWFLHPMFLDPVGLVALWREGLLARKVLLGETRGYLNHPQLDRFKAQAAPVASLDCYLYEVWYEATERIGYNFNRKLIGPRTAQPMIPVSLGQIKTDQIDRFIEIVVNDSVLLQTVTVKEFKK